MADQVQEKFVLGLDLDGCVADFVGRMRGIYAEWSGKELDSLSKEPSYLFPEWGISGKDEYDRLHRFAVTQKNLFESMEPIKGAPQALRRLSAEGIWIRVATHRLFIPNFHAQAAVQTINWLESYDVRYWDLCLIKDKSAVAANLFVEDNPGNIKAIEANGTKVICISNAGNAGIEMNSRANDWFEAENLIRAEYYSWRSARSMPLPGQPGDAPPEGSPLLPKDEQ